jgi:hypothetical protein
MENMPSLSGRADQLAFSRETSMLRERVELHWVNLTGIKDSISRQKNLCLKEASKA